MNIELTVAISLTCAIIGAVIGFSTFKKNSIKEALEKGKLEGALASDVSYIKVSVDDIKHGQETLGTKYTEIAKELALVHRKADVANERIDKANERIDEIVKKHQ